MLWKESLSETGRECGCWFGNSVFSSSDLGSVSTDEMIHSLIEGQFGHWWEDSIGVTSQENNVLWVTTYSRDLHILNMLKWIAASGVLGQSNIIIIYSSWCFWTNILYIFYKSSVFNRVENLWLSLFGKTNSLCIASSFNIEDSIITPDVFIVTNQGSVWVS